MLRQRTPMRRTEFKRTKPLRAAGPATAKVPVLRKRKCAQCREPFQPRSSMTRWCSPDCGAALAMVRLEKSKAKAARADRASTRAQLEALKPRAKWLQEAQAVVNRYCRLRDLALGQGCFTCGARPQQAFGGTYDAGHFRSVGSAPHLRFWTPQIRLQCVSCNRHKGGMALEFRKALVAEHGADWVDALESRNEIAKFDVSYLKRLKAVFSKKIRRMESRK